MNVQKKHQQHSQCVEKHFFALERFPSTSSSSTSALRFLPSLSSQGLRFNLSFSSFPAIFPNAYFQCESKFVAILHSIVAILRYKLRFLLKKRRVDSDFTQNFWVKIWRVGSLRLRWKLPETLCVFEWYSVILFLCYWVKFTW